MATDGREDEVRALLALKRTEELVDLCKATIYFELGGTETRQELIELFMEERARHIPDEADG